MNINDIVKINLLGFTTGRIDWISNDETLAHVVVDGVVYRLNVDCLSMIKKGE